MIFSCNGGDIGPPRITAYVAIVHQPRHHVGFVVGSRGPEVEGVDAAGDGGVVDAVIHRLNPRHAAEGVVGEEAEGDTGNLESRAMS